MIKASDIAAYLDVALYGEDIDVNMPTSIICIQNHSCVFLKYYCEDYV